MGQHGKAPEELFAGSYRKRTADHNQPALTSQRMESILTNKPSRMRWVMIGMAFLATLLNYIHRLSFTFLSADGDLRKLIPDSAFGTIAAAFFIAYAISNAFSGYVIDKLGTRIGYSLCMAV